MPSVKKKCQILKDFSAIGARVREVVGMDRGRVRELAEEFNISETSVSQYLSGKRPIPLWFLASIAEQSAISLDWLITGRGHKNIDPALRDLEPVRVRTQPHLPTARALFWATEFDRLSEPQQRAVEQMIATLRDAHQPAQLTWFKRAMMHSLIALAADHPGDTADPATVTNVVRVLETYVAEAADLGGPVRQLKARIARDLLALLAAMGEEAQQEAIDQEVERIIDEVHKNA